MWTARLGFPVALLLAGALLSGDVASVVNPPPLVAAAPGLAALHEHSRPLRVELPPADTVYTTTGAPGVTLTFDDGPDPAWTPAVLAAIRAYHARAVFCMIGYRVLAHPEIVRAVAEAGGTLCNHTTDHDPALGTEPVAAMERNLRENTALITQASGGIPPRYFRAPRGNFTPALVRVARRLGMASLGWRVTSLDWRASSARDPAAVARRVEATMRPGCIVLFHDGGAPGTHRHTVAAVELVLADLVRRGWPTVDLSRPTPRA